MVAFAPDVDRSSGSRLDPAADLRRRADEAYALCLVAPERARETAAAVMAEAADEPTALVTAMRAYGLAIRRLVGPEEATAVLRQAVDIGIKHRLGRELGQARMTYAGLLAEAGKISTALAECDEAARTLRGLDAGPLHAQRGLILTRAGRHQEAIAQFGRALPLLREAGDVAFQCRLYLNRSNALAYLGRVAAAERDIVTGVTLARSVGLHQLAATLTRNLGFVMVRRGDIPAALRLFGDAVSELDRYGRLAASFDRAEALLIAGLAGEARRCLEELIGEVIEAGYAVDAAEWHLMLADAALAEGDPAAARAFARRALTEFRAQHRPRWALLATQLEVRARWAQGERTPALARAARDAHAKLWTAGWQGAALRCLLVAGRIELDRGRLQAARGDLAQAAQARRRGPADLRAAAWYAEALLRLAGKQTRGAVTALKAGLRVVEEHAASLGATDLRVHASGLGSELAAEGVRLAVSSGKPGAVLEWIERFRAGALRRRPVRPPSDAKLAAELAELRRVTAELAQATATGADSRVLRGQQVRLEEAVRQRSRHASGRGAAAPDLDADRLLDSLGERSFVEILRVDDAMFAVTAVGGRLKLRRLGSYEAALRELESLRFSLHRLARRHGTTASLAAAEAGLQHAAQALDELLIRPVLDAVGERELVVVPTGRLHALPWPVLPSCQGRPVAVAPSATTWLAATQAAGKPRGAGRDRVVLVGGPGLEHATAEVQALTGLYRAPLTLLDAAATVDEVRTAIDGAELVHVAAHGRFRADNPQFSALDLADGPLTVYDLERVRKAPRRMVLSACDSGLSAVHPGDELMGLAGAVFSLGTSTLIASVVPVADEVTKSLMVALHERLCEGLPPARALSAAQESVAAERGVRADGFVCFGAG